MSELRELTPTPTAEEWIEAHNEWMRRFVEDPARFEHSFQTAQRFLHESANCLETDDPGPSYGASCHAYMLFLIQEEREAELERRQSLVYEIELPSAPFDTVKVLRIVEIGREQFRSSFDDAMAGVLSQWGFNRGVHGALTAWKGRPSSIDELGRQLHQVVSNLRFIAGGGTYRKP